MNKIAVVRWKQKSSNPKRQRQGMRLEGVIDVGEGSNFIHIFLDPNRPRVPGIPFIHEVNINSVEVESVTIFTEDEEPQPSLLDEHGNPIGDEVQSAEQLPVEQDDAGSTPVVPAI